jgi:hypothetical protein
VNKFGYGRGVVIIICMCEEFSYEGKEGEIQKGESREHRRMMRDRIGLGRVGKTQKAFIAFHVVWPYLLPNLLLDALLLRLLGLTYHLPLIYWGKNVDVFETTAVLLCVISILPVRCCVPLSDELSV